MKRLLHVTPDLPEVQNLHRKKCIIKVTIYFGKLKTWHAGTSQIVSAQYMLLFTCKYVIV